MSDEDAGQRSLDFEKALEELEQLVEEMERGEMPLEQALRAFERGVHLTRECQKALREAEHKVEILLKDAAGEPVPFAENDAS